MDEHIKEVKIICHKELNQVCYKYTMSHHSLILRYLNKELKEHIVFASLGLIILLCLSMMMKEIFMIGGSIYYLFLGFLALFEYFKNDLFQMNDVLNVNYINSGRRFLYKALSISFIQFLCFMIMSFVMVLKGESIVSILIYTLVPIYVSQVLTLWFVRYIYNVLGCFVVFVVSYLLTIVVMCYVDLYYVIQLSHCLLGSIVLFTIYLANIFLILKRRECILWN